MAASVTILNERLTDEIERGAVSYASRWRTTRLVAANGVPHHNINWSRPIGRWNISGTYSPESVQGLLNMHMNTRGMGKGFVFRDPADFRAEIGAGILVSVNGVMYCGKKYVVGSSTYTRVCKRIISGSATLLSGTSIDYATGIVTGGNAGDACTFQFLKAVAFDTDELPIEVEFVDDDTDEESLMRVGEVGLIEVPED